jgi:hypothetical protein
MLVGGPGVALAAAQPDSGRHDGGDSHDQDRDRTAYGRADGQTGGTGDRSPFHRLISPVESGASGQTGGAAGHHWGVMPIGLNIPLGGGVQLRSGLELDDGVRIGGGVRIGPDLAMLQSANVNPGGQAGNGPTPEQARTNLATPSVASPSLASPSLASPNLPTSVQPSPNRLGVTATPGGSPIGGLPPEAIPNIPATAPLPAAPALPLAPRAPAMPPLPGTAPLPAIPPPIFIPPPASPPTAGPPSALISGPSLSPAPVVQTPPPPTNAPLKTIAPVSPPGQLPYRAGYSDVLQRASTTELAVAAAPGVTGIFLMTGCGVFVGYRRAKLGNMVEAVNISRFIR